MKKFMLLVALIFGVPSFAVADTLGCAGGGAVGAGLGSLVGKGNGTLAAQVILGLMGCSAGSRMEDGTYGQNGNVETVVVHQGAQGSGYVGGRGPTCYDQGSGGYADCDELARRYRYNGANYSQSYQQRTSYTQQQPVFVRHQRTVVQQQQVVEKVETKPTVNNYGPTVDNYFNSPMIHPSCRTVGAEGTPVNHGSDGRCLLSKVALLANEQIACECIASGEKTCEVDLKRVACPKGYNPGVWAGVYSRLGRELVELQKKEQGGDVTMVAKQ